MLWLLKRTDSMLWFLWVSKQMFKLMDNKISTILHPNFLLIRDKDIKGKDIKGKQSMSMCLCLMSHQQISRTYGEEVIA